MDALGSHASPVRAPATQSRSNGSSGALIAAAALGVAGGSFTGWYDRLPRLAARSMVFGAVAGLSGAAALSAAGRANDHGGRGERIPKVGMLAALGGAALLGGLAGIIMPSVSAVTRMPALFEFGIYGAAIGLVGGATVAAISTPQPTARQV